MSIIRSTFYFIDSLIYWLIREFYNVFIGLCNGQLLDSSTINSLFSRVGLLLGVVMMFRVAFSFVQVLINPDSFNDSEKGIPGIVKKVIVVIIMFGMSSYVFTFLRTLQGEIIESNVISKFLLPQQVDTDNFGGILEAELFTAFYNLNPNFNYKVRNECGNEDYITGLKKSIAEENSFSYNKECINESGKINSNGWFTYGDKEFYIEFNCIFSTIIGIFTVYFLVNYCISVGVRLIQLTFLQIISPMAIVGYLSPKKDNMFTKWLKVYFSTYIDIFLRMAIINFGIYLIALLIDGYNDANSIFYISVGASGFWTKKIIFVLMVMAIFTFAKKAPDLLKKIFPATSESAINLGIDKDNQAGIGVVKGATVGAATAVLGGGVMVAGSLAKGDGFGALKAAVGTLFSAEKGAFDGGKSGYKSNDMKSVREARAQANLSRMNSQGVPYRERAANWARDRYGLGEGTRNSHLQEVFNNAKEIQTTIENERFYKEMRELQETKRQQMVNSGESQSEIHKEMKNWDKAIDALRDQAYAAAHNKENVGKESGVPISVNIGDQDFKFDYKVKQSLHNMIESNELRAGKSLNDYDSYQTNRDELETKLANSHKVGGKK